MLLRTKFKIGQFVFTSKDGAGIITGITICITETTKKIEYEIKKTRTNFDKTDAKFIYAFESEVFKSAWDLIRYVNSTEGEYLITYYKKYEVIYYNAKDSFDYGLFNNKNNILNQSIILKGEYECEKN